MLFQTRLCATMFLACTASAFVVDFYEESNCAGEDLGNWVGGEGQGCQTLDVGQAGGAVIQGTGSVDDNTAVVFYSSNNCDLSTAVAQADNGCVGVSDFAVNFQSFNVIGIDETTKKLKKKRSSSADTPYGYSHGVVASYGGVSYKWHQVADGAYQGILPSQWDDSVHVQNTTQLPDVIPATPTRRDSSATGRDISLREPAELFERNFLYYTCQAVAECYLHAVGPAGAAYDVGVVASLFVDKVQQLGGNAIWGYMNAPVVVRIVIPTATGLLGGAMSGRTTNKVVASQCSNTQTDADTIKSILNDFATKNPQRAFQMNIKAGNIQGTLSVEAIPDSQRGDGDTCGAPATDPTTLGGGRRSIGWTA